MLHNKRDEFEAVDGVCCGFFLLFIFFLSMMMLMPKHSRNHIVIEDPASKTANLQFVMDNQSEVTSQDTIRVQESTTLSPREKEWEMKAVVGDIGKSFMRLRQMMIQELNRRANKTLSPNDSIDHDLAKESPSSDVRDIETSESSGDEKKEGDEEEGEKEEQRFHERPAVERFFLRIPDK